MAKTPCGMWRELILGTDPYTGLLIAEFLAQKDVLVEHLNTCKSCYILVNKRLSADSSTADFKNMPNRDFELAIRRLTRFSRQRTTKAP